MKNIVIIILFLIILIISAIIVKINKNIEVFSTSNSMLKLLNSQNIQISASGNNIWAVGPNYYAYRQDGKIWKLIDKIPLSKISVSGNNVWGIQLNQKWGVSNTYYRTCISENTPGGKEWVNVNISNFKKIINNSVSGLNTISVSGNNIWYVSTNSSISPYYPNNYLCKLPSNFYSSINNKCINNS